MKEEFKIVASITAKASLIWLVVVLAGNLLTFICLLTILFQKSTTLTGGHGNLYAFIVDLYLNEICGFILFIGTPIFAFLYIIIANKITIQTIIHNLWKNKMESYISSKVVFFVDKLTTANDWTSTISNGAILKLKLLEANRNDVENSKIKKRIINYLFTKIKLDDIDFTNKDLKMSEIITYKLNNFISEKVKPSFLFFWLLVSFQLILAISTYIM